MNKLNLCLLIHHRDIKARQKLNISVKIDYGLEYLFSFLVIHSV